MIAPVRGNADFNGLPGFCVFTSRPPAPLSRGLGRSRLLALHNRTHQPAVKSAPLWLALSVFSLFADFRLHKEAIVRFLHCCILSGYLPEVLVLTTQCFCAFSGYCPFISVFSSVNRIPELDGGMRTRRGRACALLTWSEGACPVIVGAYSCHGRTASSSAHLGAGFEWCRMFFPPSSRERKWPGLPTRCG